MNVSTLRRSSKMVAGAVQARSKKGEIEKRFEKGGRKVLERLLAHIEP